MEDLYKKLLASSGVCTDSRNVAEKCIYFALKGNSFDGNLFAEEALNKGALYAVVDNPNIKLSERTILVEDVLTTLQKLASYHRRKLKTPIIAITGSNGKTTTKELIKSVLSEAFNVVATEGNLNNHIGVPLTILSITPETEIAIVEMGANHPKEIEFLCSITEPDYGYITSIGKAHLEGFGSFEGVVKAKGELYDYLKQQDKTIIFNNNDELQKKLLSDYQNVYSFGNEPEVNVFVECLGINPVEVSFRETSVSEVLNASEEVTDTTEIEDFSSEKIKIKSNLVGKYNFTNIAAAIAFARFFKISSEAIKRGVEKYVPKNNRSQIINQQTNTILLDAYNANPSSMSEAIMNAVEIQGFKKKILILGDMFELGDYAAQEHQNIVNLVEKNTWEKVFLVGENFFKTKSKYPKFKTFEDFQKVFVLKDFSNSFILIKGSRGMALERILK
ncbi:UDP-N-acetylmuramoyl-tripeptide--D-alanyl-D-alanine ligase [Capnocytophaga cynodegmi]|uniref:UDP-N-acetylmuramoyl-tripeptide--D-alanyl-D-alanine ligase n=1 Tax=Capnocytophaga cynodegmi TaxID=28189 RepID=A0A250E5S7_9FLAO|nr:UDP-N-acetylmuramoyl-tripeptide--D-alanyl-D-alanine ligase [Capnocytophaga cynodegmi]ATA68340.1 UDP-N-acetylmuramoyl-tripeptide--D-alanyl-D-alanine ligase [Capnocytophaga cynodegmi]